MLIGILVTAAGFLGIEITILAIFFQVKPSKERTIHPKTMALIIIWLTLMTLGFVNLYYTLSGKNDDPGKRDENSITASEEIATTTATDDKNAVYPQEESFINKNHHLIQQLKKSYSEADTKTVENDRVNFRITEKAGFVYQDLMRRGEPDILDGVLVSSAKVIVLDYDSDDIIYVYTSSNGTVCHLPSNHDKFYCVVVHDDYDIYVTSPIQVVGGEEYGSVEIHLNKKGSNYTPLSQIHLHIGDSKSDRQYSINPTDYAIRFSCKTTYDGTGSTSYSMSMPASGILSLHEGTYFSLNTDYVMDISLFHSSDKDTELANQTFDGLITDSNLTEIFFELDNEIE